MSTHTIKTIWNGKEIAIAFDFLPSATLDTDAEGDGYPADVDFISAETDQAVDQGALDKWAERWLNGKGYELAIAHAEAAR